MPRKDDDVFDVLMELPWWVSVMVAAVVYIGLRFILPSLSFESEAVRSFARTGPKVAWGAVIFLIPAAGSLLTRKRKRSLLDKQRGIGSILELSWREFEHLAGEAFRRRGYRVVENTSGGPDGGIDLKIEKNRNVYLVQCKHYRSAKVGVSVVREMLGLVTAHRAHGAIIITTGVFTQEARTFAQNVPVDLVEGQAVVDLVRSVQPNSASMTAASVRATDTVQATAVGRSASGRMCPRCGSPLVIRHAKRGRNAGSEFLGCTTFPKCKHTENIA